MNGIDMAIMVAYCVGIVALGCWAGLRRRRASTSQGYFMAARSSAGRRSAWRCLPPTSRASTW